MPPSPRETHDVQDLETSETKSSPAAKSIQADTSNADIRILPYVIYDGGAYQLPVSLELELKSKLQRPKLTERLAFLSPGQIQTLQDLLKYNCGEQVRKLTHLEVMKKPSQKFWRKSIKVMIAFVEGETSSMPAAISSGRDDPTSTEAVHGSPEQPQKTAVTIPSGEGRSLAAQAENTLPLTSHGPNITYDIPSAAPASAQQLSRAKGLNSAGLPGFQDVTPHLTHEEEWRERSTEYRVWTIQPSTKQTQPPSGDWDRCVLSEAYLSVAEIKRRLDVLDKDSLTVLQKTTMLEASQQVQITQSIEAAKASTIDHNYRWTLRQLEILRAKRFFRAEHVKAIVVYVSGTPLLQTFHRPEESQRQRTEVDKDSYNPLSSAAVKKKHNTKRFSSDYDESATYSERVTGRGRDRTSEWVNKNGYNMMRDEIERANNNIASRPSRSPVPHRRFTSPTRTSSTYTRSRITPRYPPIRHRPSSPGSRSRISQQPTSTVFINNRVHTRPDSSDESDSSEQDNVGGERHYSPRSVK
jgi:hypothetical protein